MRAAGRAQHVVGIVHVGHPVAEGFVDGVLEDARAVAHGHHLGPQAFHPEDVGPLARHVHLAHVNGAAKAETRGHGGRGHAMLAGAGLGDDARFAHALDEQSLAHDVVGLVGAGVVQVFALDVDLRAAEMARSGSRRRSGAWAVHE